MRRLRSVVKALDEKADGRITRLLVSVRGTHKPPEDAGITDELAAIVEECRPFTLVSRERLVANMDAVEYAIRRGVPGAIVECGVWRGGSVLAMVRMLQAAGVSDREVWLYDTFEGMTEPSEHDVSRYGRPAVDVWRRDTAMGRVPWGHWFDPASFSVDDVRSVLAATGYPEQLFNFVVGKVEDTIPARLPTSIAVLRLDTDWYESTAHEMQHLYPRISPGGVLIIDDYGHWDGARKAVDEYLADAGEHLLLQRTDYTARMAIKV